MGKPVGRRPWGADAGRIMTPIALYPILREYIDAIEGEYTDYITGLLLSDMERFINTDHNGQEPNYAEFKEKGKQELTRIKELRSKVRMEKDARYLKNPPSGEEEMKALETYLRSIAPFQKAKIQSLCRDFKVSDLLPFQEACEKKTGVWVRHVIFTRKFPIREIPPE